MPRNAPNKQNDLLFFLGLAYDEWQSEWLKVGHQAMFQKMIQMNQIIHKDYSGACDVVAVSAAKLLAKNF